MYKLLRKNKNSIILFIILLTIFILILIQNLLGVLSFDDFGYGSLTYGIEKINFPKLYNIGNNYNIIQIMKFLLWHYFGWGGRIPAFFILIVLLKFNPIVIKIMQSIVMFACFNMISKISNSGGNRERVYNMIFMFAFFWLSNISIYREGVMWFTASVVYLWTSAFISLLIIILFSQKLPTKRMKIIVFFGFFIGGWTHEFTGLMICVTSLFYNICIYIFQKRINIFKFSCFLFSILGYFILIFAPGSKARIQDRSNLQFYNLKFSERLFLRGKDELNLIFSNNLLPIIVLFFLCLFIISVYIFSREHKKKFYSIIPILILSDFIYYFILYNSNVLNLTIYKCIFIIVTLALTIYIMIKNAMIRKNGQVISLVIGNIAMYLSGLVVPYGGDRTLLPFFIFVPMILFYLLRETNFKINICILSITILFASINYIYIFNGYLNNFPLRQENVSILNKSSLEIKSDKKLTKIILNKYDLTFAESSPWGSASYQQYWMRYYYDIPQNIKIIYKNRNKTK